MMQPQENSIIYNQYLQMKQKQDQIANAGLDLFLLSRCEKRN